jgi:uncharacterized membrane protein YccC
MPTHQRMIRTALPLIAAVMLSHLFHAQVETTLFLLLLAIFFALAAIYYRLGPPGASGGCPQ